MPAYIIIEGPSEKEWENGIFEAASDAESEREFLGYLKKRNHFDRGDVRFKRTDMDLLTYYPRMARPQAGFSTYIGMPGSGPLFRHSENAQPPLPHDANSLASSLNQLTILVRSLGDIFRSVEPSQANLQTYGHLIRNTLLLAAMDFENECKGVLGAHGYTPKSPKRWSTIDFVKVLEPLRLQEFEVNLSFYPGIVSRKPFQQWDAKNPTQSLPWYDAYNAVKHDRENEFQRATLEAAIDAVTACAIMLAAQYRVIPDWRDQIGGFFAFTRSPEWQPSQRYLAYPKNGKWKEVRYNF